ncbi:hypothetical protein M427DRAFT_98607 [Gonapodya prolifera JEL478]|uniref:HMG box domain-containing protein n=1 Tax=Gonapodya prolifera (strain JEL478) TaxID=1344416 RepID=A0A139AG39_GONPJ|nr:hypothetical protein M427DRAFT_98607 [Gonapodya prolifera JEL478]|eukprot:KXS15771.1 hypothetical protein M427DRAFT_98607 [Gonapodya prolifera JEL478]
MVPPSDHAQAIDQSFGASALRVSSVPRPPNSFILYRREASRAIISEHLERGEAISNIKVSKLVGERWANESREVKQKYAKMALECRKKHMELYPGYKYTPRKQKPRRCKREHNEVMSLFDF